MSGGQCSEVFKSPVKRRTIKYLLEQLSLVIDELYYVCTRASFDTTTRKVVQIFDSSMDRFKNLEGWFDDSDSDSASFTSVNPNGRSMSHESPLQIKSQVKTPDSESVMVSSTNYVEILDITSSEVSMNSQTRNDVISTNFCNSFSSLGNCHLPGDEYSTGVIEDTWEISKSSDGGGHVLEFKDNEGDFDDVTRDVEYQWQIDGGSNICGNKFKSLKNAINNGAKQFPSTPFSSLRVRKYIQDYRLNTNPLVTLVYPA